MNLQAVLCRVFARASWSQAGLRDRIRLARLLRNWDQPCGTGKTCGEEVAEQIALLAIADGSLQPQELRAVQSIDWSKLIELIVRYLPVVLEIIRAILDLFTSRESV